MKNVFKLDFSNIRGDFFGGLTAGIVALPLALAFGAQTELGAMAGLYGAIAIAILAAFFGGTPTQISGPTAPMTVVSAAVIASAITKSGATSVEEALPLIIATFFLAGAIEALMGVIKLGRYIRYIPYPVVSGFMSGIGVIIIITQIFPLLGYNPTNDTDLVDQKMPHAEELILEKILQQEEAEGVLSGIMSKEDLAETTRRAEAVSVEEIRDEAKRLAKQEASGTKGTILNIMRPFSIPGMINWINLGLGLLTILIIYGFKRITKAIPSSLVSLIIVTPLAFFLFRGQIPIIGAVESGIPPIHLNFFGSYMNLGTLGIILEFALTLAALGAIDSLLTSVVADNITKTRHDSDQELIGQGLGNMAAALFGGLPGAGATMRTVINVQSGGKTKISGVISGFFLLAVLLGLGPIVAYIPNAVLAGILITVGIGIIDYKGLKHLRSVPRSDAAVMIAVLLLTVFVDLLVAVALGLILAAILFMKKISDVVEYRTNSAPLKEFAREVPWKDEGNIIEQIGDKIYIKHLDGPLFFGFASRFQQMVNALPEIKVVILRMEKVPYVDQSGLYAMEEAVLGLRQRGIVVAFTGLHGQPKDMFEQINLLPGLINEEYSFETFADCTRWLKPYIHEANLQYLADEQSAEGKSTSMQSNNNQLES
ncbi:MAG: SulP family inorganic anion transporter [Chitinophagales bacterium]|nr:SulP family inorganic anion transporter [Chitinophagales bacterium]